MLAGKKVQDINSIAKSYGNTLLRALFRGVPAKEGYLFL